MFRGAVAAGLTASGLSIVDTMVSVNVVYIASVGPSLFGLLRGKDGQGVDETWSIAAGFFAALSVFITTWLGWTVANVELLALVIGLSSATLARVALHRRHADFGYWVARR